MRLVLAVASLCLVLWSCNATLGGPCQATCDCPALNAPIRCPGEWGCNAQKTCEYTCKTICGSGSGTDAGCAAGETCNGAICTARSTCP